MTTTDRSPARYRIAEVAQMSGFTPTTLRFYEQAGVLAPPERTTAGYRSYDDRDVERLQLIARAKDLGCTLDEIRDLVQAWDDDRCGPVKHRLRSLVDAKITAVQDHLAEQAAFAVQLQATAAALADRPLDGPCDDSCGCTAATPDTVASSHGSDPEMGSAASVALAARAPRGEGEPVIACSLSGSEVGTRLEDWRTALDSVVGRRSIHEGVRLELDPQAPLEEIARLMAAEHACCPFFGFALTVDERGIALELRAPAEGQDLLRTVFGTAP